VKGIQRPVKWRTPSAYLPLPAQTTQCPTVLGALALEDHAELAKIAVELLGPGRPMPTVQDVVRGLVRGALKDHDTLLKLVRKGGV
jgi:hypothetical protein